MTGWLAELGRCLICDRRMKALNSSRHKLASCQENGVAPTKLPAKREAKDHGITPDSECLNLSQHINSDLCK